MRWSWASVLRPPVSFANARAPSIDRKVPSRHRLSFNQRAGVGRAAHAARQQFFEGRLPLSTRLKRHAIQRPNRISFGFNLNIVAALVGIILQIAVFRRMKGQDLRQTLVTIGISIVLADLMLWAFGGNSWQIQTPTWLRGPMDLPLVTAVKSSGEAVYLSYPIGQAGKLERANVTVGLGEEWASHQPFTRQSAHKVQSRSRRDRGCARKGP
jgi:hypothetical protein